jgi:putative oxidoreductase
VSTAVIDGTSGEEARAGWLRHPWVHRGAAVVLGAVFLYACWDKILQPVEFAKIVYHYRIIGPDARLGFVPANLLAATLPWVELVAGLLLVLNVWRREAAAVCGVMLVAFLVAVSYALLQGIDLANCGCFSVAPGTDGRALGWKLLAGDTVLLVVAALLTAVPPRDRP